LDADYQLLWICSSDFYDVFVLGNQARCATSRREGCVMMIRTLVLLILTLVAANAHAEWILHGDNGKAEFYYEDKTIVTNGSYVTVWEMLNYSFPLNDVLSNRSHKEYDCKATKFRNLQGEFFNAPYLKGEKISSNMDPEDNWRPVVEGTQNQHLMQLVCGMRS
jgi:hypothetical protein